jgi:hypothetical protein
MDSDDDLCDRKGFHLAAYLDAKGISDRAPVDNCGLGFQPPVPSGNPSCGNALLATRKAQGARRIWPDNDAIWSLR